MRDGVKDNSSCLNTGFKKVCGVIDILAAKIEESMKLNLDVKDMQDKILNQEKDIAELKKTINERIEEENDDKI